MKKSMKRLAAAFFAAALSLSAGFTSLAFYQEPASKKGLLISQQHMFDDVLELGVDQVICNQASYQNLDTYMPLAQNCKNNGITFTMILLNNFGASDPDLLPVDSPVEGVGNYAFNSTTSSETRSMMRPSGITTGFPIWMSMLPAMRKPSGFSMRKSRPLIRRPGCLFPLT